MLGLIVLTMSLFATAFGGTWTCAVHPPTTVKQPHVLYSTWRIAPAPGGRWTAVTWGTRAEPGGLAYVGYDGARKLWIYDDYHFDGSFYRDFSTGPDRNGTWRWYGTADQWHLDRSDGPVSWKRAGARAFIQTYRAMRAGKLRDFGYARCSR